MSHCLPFKIISLQPDYSPLPSSSAIGLYLYLYLHCICIFFLVFCLLGWKCLFKIISLHPDYSPLPSASAGSPVPSLAPPRHRDFQANTKKYEANTITQLYLPPIQCDFQQTRKRNTREYKKKNNVKQNKNNVPCTEPHTTAPYGSNVIIHQRL